MELLTLLKEQIAKDLREGKITINTKTSNSETMTSTVTHELTESENNAYKNYRYYKKYEREKDDVEITIKMLNPFLLLILFSFILVIGCWFFCSYPYTYDSDSMIGILIGIMGGIR